MARARYVENGTHYIIFVSVAHPKVPLDEANYVRAKVLISAFVCEPLGEGKTKMTRMALIDPAGNIPTPVVNMNAKGTNAVILWLRKNVN